MRQFLFVLLMLSSSQVLGVSSSVLGTSEAQRCFEESRMVLSMSGADACTKAIDHGDLTRRDLAATYSNRGIIYSNNGEFQRALSDHNKAIKLKPNLGQAYINRGNVHYHLRDFSEALQDYEMAMTLGNVPLLIALYNQGLVLVRLHRNGDAIAAFEAALEISPDSVKIQKQLQTLRDL